MPKTNLKFKIIFPAIIFFAFFALVQSADAATYYVSTNGSDSNPGSQSQPFSTVGRALDGVSSGDIVNVSAGNFNLNGYSKTLNFPVSIIGAGQNSTILTNGGMLTVVVGITVKNLTFSNTSSNVINLVPGVGGTIDGVIIESVTFKDLSNASAIQSVHATIAPDGPITTFKNIKIKNCLFENIICNSANRYAFGIINYPMIGKIDILNNTFRNLINTRTDSGISAIVIAGNSNSDHGPYPSPGPVMVSGNVMDTVRGMGATEVHAAGYLGNNGTIKNNTVRNLSSGEGHEAIYTKGANHIIENNFIDATSGGCGSTDGCIDVKGELTSLNNIVRGNKIIAEAGKRMIQSYGNVYIDNNYGYWPGAGANGYSGFGVVNLGRHAEITNNTIIAGKNWAVSPNRFPHDESECVSVPCAWDFLVAGNLLVTKEGYTGLVNNRTQPGVTVTNNVEYIGYDYSSLQPPLPTCQNMGHRCCDTVVSGRQTQLDSSCSGGMVCADVCGAFNLPFNNEIPGSPGGLVVR